MKDVTKHPVLAIQHADGSYSDRMLWAEILGEDMPDLPRTDLGDYEGHPFRGNQWTTGEGGGAERHVPKVFTSEEGYQWHEQGPVPEWAAQLPYAEANALGSYASFSYSDINNVLRGSYTDPITSQFVRAATPEEIAKAEAVKDWGINREYIEKFGHPFGRSDAAWREDDPYM